MLSGKPEEKFESKGMEQDINFLIDQHLSTNPMMDLRELIIEVSKSYKALPNSKTLKEESKNIYNLTQSEDGNSLSILEARNIYLTYLIKNKIIEKRFSEDKSYPTIRSHLNSTVLDTSDPIKNFYGVEINNKKYNLISTDSITDILEISTWTDIENYESAINLYLSFYDFDPKNKINHGTRDELYEINTIKIMYFNNASDRRAESKATITHIALAFGCNASYIIHKNYSSYYISSDKNKIADRIMSVYGVSLSKALKIYEKSTFTTSSIDREKIKTMLPSFARKMELIHNKSFPKTLTTDSTALSTSSSSTTTSSTNSSTTPSALPQTTPKLECAFKYHDQDYSFYSESIAKDIEAIKTLTKEYRYDEIVKIYMTILNPRIAGYELNIINNLKKEYKLGDTESDKETAKLIYIKRLTGVKIFDSLVSDKLAEIASAHSSPQAHHFDQKSLPGSQPEDQLLGNNSSSSSSNFDAEKKQSEFNAVSLHSGNFHFEKKDQQAKLLEVKGTTLSEIDAYFTLNLSKLENAKKLQETLQYLSSCLLKLSHEINNFNNENQTIIKEFTSSINKELKNINYLVDTIIPERHQRFKELKDGVEKFDSLEELQKQLKKLKAAAKSNQTHFNEFTNYSNKLNAESLRVLKVYSDKASQQEEQKDDELDPLKLLMQLFEKRIALEEQPGFLTESIKDRASIEHKENIDPAQPLTPEQLNNHKEVVELAEQLQLAPEHFSDPEPIYISEQKEGEDFMSEPGASDSDKAPLTKVKAIVSSSTISRSDLKSQTPSLDIMPFPDLQPKDYELTNENILEPEGERTLLTLTHTSMKTKGNKVTLIYELPEGMEIAQITPLFIQSIPIYNKQRMFKVTSNSISSSNPNSNINHAKMPTQSRS